MNFEELKENIDRDRKNFESLTASERWKYKRLNRISSLLDVNYITSDEAEKYGEFLTELPTDKRELAVYYYLIGLDRYAEEPISMENMKKINKVFANIPASARVKIQSGGCLADGMTGEEVRDFVSEFDKIATMENIKRAETYVYSKRGRIKYHLLKYIRIEIAALLNSDEINTTPYLKGLLQDKGYKDKSKLTDIDKEAIEEVAEYYLNLMELSFLNGTAEIRQGENDKNQDNREWSEIDEALNSFNTPLVMDIVIGSYYNEATAKGAVRELIELYNQTLNDNSTVIDKLKASKFRYLFEEDSVC